jgi:3-isopropylmalate/(R)-2-methylmalate dehydratase small subunit
LSRREIDELPLLQGVLMEPFTKHTGIVATLDRANVDTDQIIPKQFLKRIERTGFGEFLFFDWRFKDDGQPDPDFELNKPEFQKASILVTRRNFGSGSSREHAVWALAQYGIRSILAPSFADIFYNNCFKNGLLPVVLDEETIDQLFQRVATTSGYQLSVDLQELRVTDAAGLNATFEVEAARRERLFNGLDDIAMTLGQEKRIAEYEASRGIG